MTSKLCPITKCIDCPNCQVAMDKSLPLGSLACFEVNQYNSGNKPRLINLSEEIQSWCKLQDAS